MNKSDFKVIIWPTPEWEIPALKKSFSRLNLEVDQKAAIGAGADGNLPEINILIELAAISFATGFMRAMGADAWHKLKDSIKKAWENKPKKVSNLASFVWWTHFKDKQVIIVFAGSDEELELALELLPKAFDAASKLDPDFNRFDWAGDKKAWMWWVNSGVSYWGVDGLIKEH